MDSAFDLEASIDDTTKTKADKLALQSGANIGGDMRLYQKNQGDLAKLFVLKKPLIVLPVKNLLSSLQQFFSNKIFVTHASLERLPGKK